MGKVTVVITSCNRWNLLERTLDSFFALNTYPVDKILLNEDSGNIEIVKKILDKYGDRIHILRSPKNEGLLKSIDNLYKLVDTPYILGVEDDWEFRGNPNFIQQSLDILEGNKGIHQIWMRNDAEADWIENENFGIYRMMKEQHCGDWCGFSFNARTVRLNDYKRMFPNGFSEYNLPHQTIVHSEHKCNQVAHSQGYRAAILTNSACHHIGSKQSTYQK